MAEDLESVLADDEICQFDLQSREMQREPRMLGGSVEQLGRMHKGIVIASSGKPSAGKGDDGLTRRSKLWNSKANVAQKVESGFFVKKALQKQRQSCLENPTQET